MITQLFIGFLLSLLVLTQGWSATYTVGPGGDYATIAAVNAASFNPGDIIDGQNLTFYERLTIPSSGSSGGGYITFQNTTLDGTVSFDGLWTFYGGNSYSSQAQTPWVNVSGEIWLKYSSRIPFQLYEDTVLLSPIVCADEAAVISNLARGGWSGVNSVSHVYYRASDGANPNTHAIRVSGRNYDDTPGLLNIVSKSYVKLTNVSCNSFCINNLDGAALRISGSNHIILNSYSTKYNYIGVALGSGSSFITVNSDCNISDNIASGIGAGGDGNHDIILRGTYDSNGRHLSYDQGASLTYASDGDGIGIGQNGGTMYNYTIEDAIITNSGGPDGNATTHGSGLYVGTSFDMNITNLIVRRVHLKGNHFYGFNIQQVVSGAMYDCIISGHAAGPGNYAGNVISVTNSDFSYFNFDNNVVAKNDSGYAIVFVRNGIISGGTVRTRNNCFYDNGNATTYTGDILFEAAMTNTVHSNNSFWRSATAWGTTKLVNVAGSYSNLSQVTTFEATAQNTDPVFINGTGALTAAADFKIPITSPCYGTGVDVSLSPRLDYFSNVWKATPSIGAHEPLGFKGIPVGGFTP